MKIAFTICSNNYLSQAKALGDSLKIHNPDYEFYIGLVDEYSEAIDYSKEINHNIILAKDIDIPDFDSLWKKYDIIELNTCVKPFYFEYFTNKIKPLEYLLYLDPDTFVFSSFKELEDDFGDSHVLLTPHIIEPLPIDEKLPSESLFLNYGIYNLGFLGLKDPQKSTQLIQWWGERTYHLGYSKVSKGLFVDQLWFNLVPLFFPNVKISFNLGLNMAPWNIQERFLEQTNKDFIVNKKHKLVFYHFSTYKYDSPRTLSLYNRYTLDERKDLNPIYSIYLEKIHKSDVEKISKIKCIYVERRKEFLPKSTAKKNNKLKSYLRKIYYYLDDNKNLKQ